MKKQQPPRRHTARAKTKNITIGNATVCFNKYEGAWVKPGGALMYKKSEAQAFCQQLAQAWGR